MLRPSFFLLAPPSLPPYRLRGWNTISLLIRPLSVFLRSLSVGRAHQTRFIVNAKMAFTFLVLVLKAWLLLYLPA